MDNDLISPAPTIEEAVAIVAALEALWPRPSGREFPDNDRSDNWRFSGRWWRNGTFAPSAQPWVR